MLFCRGEAVLLGPHILVLGPLLVPQSRPGAATMPSSAARLAHAGAPRALLLHRSESHAKSCRERQDRRAQSHRLGWRAFPRPRPSPATSSSTNAKLFSSAPPNVVHVHVYAARPISCLRAQLSPPELGCLERT